MNKEMLHKVADLLEEVHHARPDDFKMSDWGDENKDVMEALQEKPMRVKCNSAACIAGWTTMVFGSVRSDDSFEYQAKSILDLDDNLSNHLFIPDQEGDVDPFKSTAIGASRVVRHLAETGVVDWDLSAPLPNDGPDHSLEA